MIVRLALVAALAGCGRIDFDPHAGGDAAPRCLPKAEEVCNGVDDDCDRLVDEGCPCAPFDVTLSTGIGRTIVSTGDEYLLEAGGFLRVDATGAEVGTVTSPSYADGNSRAGFAWDGARVVF